MEQIKSIGLWHLFFANFVWLLFEITCTFLAMSDSTFYLAVIGWILFPLCIYVQKTLTLLFGNTIFKLEKNEN